MYTERERERGRKRDLRFDEGFVDLRALCPILHPLLSRAKFNTHPVQMKKNALLLA